jgi:hypothetical protein
MKLQAMIKQIISFLSLVLLANSWAIAEGSDMEVSFNVSPTKKQALFDTVISKTLPGKSQSDLNKLRVALIKNVKTEDQQALGILLQGIINPYLAKTTFTPQFVKYTEVPTPTITLSPKGNEAAQLIIINQNLSNALAQYNATKKTNYVFQMDTLPGMYTPNLIIALSDVYKSSQVKPHLVAGKINAFLARTSFDLLHDSPTPVSSTSSQTSKMKLPKKERKASKKALGGKKKQEKTSKIQRATEKKAARDQAKTAKQQAKAENRRTQITKSKVKPSKQRLRPSKWARKFAGKNIPPMRGVALRNPTPR